MRGTRNTSWEGTGTLGGCGAAGGAAGGLGRLRMIFWGGTLTWRASGGLHGASGSLHGASGGRQGAAQTPGQGAPSPSPQGIGTPPPPCGKVYALIILHPEAINTRSTTRVERIGSLRKSPRGARSWTEPSTPGRYIRRSCYRKDIRKSLRERQNPNPARCARGLRRGEGPRPG